MSINYCTIYLPAGPAGEDGSPGTPGSNGLHGQPGVAGIIPVEAKQSVYTNRLYLIMRSI